VAHAIVDEFPKFDERGFIPKRSRDQHHAPFGGNVFTPGVGLAAVDPLAKLNKCGCIHSRNIESF